MNGNGILNLASHQCADLLFDIGFLRNGNLLETTVIRNGNILAAQAPYGRIDVVESGASNHGGDHFSCPAACLTGFMHNQQTPCARHRINDGLGVERQQCARVDDLDFDPFLRESFRDIEGFHHHDVVGDHGDIAPCRV